MLSSKPSSSCLKTKSRFRGNGLFYFGPCMWKNMNFLPPVSSCISHSSTLKTVKTKTTSSSDPRLWSKLRRSLQRSHSCGHRKRPQYIQNKTLVVSFQIRNRNMDIEQTRHIMLLLCKFKVCQNIHFHMFSHWAECVW